MNLYLHIPFCASRCSYCDFFTQTGSRWRRDFHRALLSELRMRQGELPAGEKVRHIYLGGGTPSLLSIDELREILSTIRECYSLESTGGEYTIECNPDDVTSDYAEGLSSLGFNRVSMGVQSFDEEDLKFLNRRHSAQQVLESVESLRRAGITNLSLDLIYGLPHQTLSKWNANLDKYLALRVPHLSAYHLIYEEGTPLTRLVELGRVRPVSEEASLSFFETLIQRTKEAGYEHYEISNFAQPGAYAQHNTGYWLGEAYLGFGPSAHSYDGDSTRSYNPPTMRGYTEELLRGERTPEVERLTNEELQHEFLMTRLRTQWGFALTDFTERFGRTALDEVMRLAHPYIADGRLRYSPGSDRLQLTEQGVFTSDGIIADLFV